VSLAPSQEIIQRAIALQVQQTQEKLSEQLTAAVPEIKISQVKLKTLEGLYVGHLPTYHLHGRYTLELTLPNQDVKQSANDFDLYLQRQAEGKTWRWLQPADPENPEHPHRWLTYRIHAPAHITVQ
jgi:hypothetical protein